ncbi:hypothetical protein [Actinomadura sp. 9N215]|uniref:hypothetical protein n=1 Tax=Actinomadura sp. 9N215 TaxID=3375150 RepID=UPI0037AE6542
MHKKIAIPLALVGLLFGAVACDGDGENTAKGPSSPQASTTPTTPTSAPPASAAPTTSASAAPRATPSDPKITNSRTIVMIDPDGKSYTYTKMAQLAAGMRMTFGDNPPSGFCAKSYQEGLSGGGKFPAGREAYVAACQEGWKKTEQWWGNRSARPRT